MKALFKVLVVVFLFTATAANAQNEPLAILLTWTKDPTTTISIDWHSMDEKAKDLFYREKGAIDWKRKKSKTHPFPFSDRIIHRVGLKGLQAETSYEIRFGENGKVYFFNTMPSDIANNPIRIAIGGDTKHEKEMLEKTNREVLNHDPHFVIMGGDLAYENGDSAAIERVYDWLDACKNTLITEDGRIIPIVVGIGNHEVAGGYYSPEHFNGQASGRVKHAPYFYNLFAFPGQPGYNVLDFGTYLSLIILDSGHTNTIAGEQSDWLATELKKRGQFLNVVPVYHVGAYPSVRDYDNLIAAGIRKYWVPLFEQHDVKIAFENHDHAYKRSFPIREDKVDEEGIVFFGDGAWGVNVREVHNVDDTWYLKKALSQRHFILLTLEGSEKQVTTINEEGEVIDTYPEIQH
jgi:hypothetical protein